MKLAKFLLAGAIFNLALGGLVHAGGESSKTVKVEQVTELQNTGTLVLDVRELGEYAEAHIAGSTLIPLGQLAQRLQELSADKSKPDRKSVV